MKMQFNGRLLEVPDNDIIYYDSLGNFRKLNPIRSNRGYYGFKPDDKDLFEEVVDGTFKCWYNKKHCRIEDGCIKFDKRFIYRIKNYKECNNVIQKIINMFENGTINQEKFETCLYKLLDEIINIDFDFLKDFNSICVCGNGPDGYEENISNNFIDSHDIVVRINNYRIIENITGKKTTFHFIGGTKTEHIEIVDYLPELNNSEYIIYSKNKSFESRLKSKINNSIQKPIIKYNDVINNFLENFFKKYNLSLNRGNYMKMSGLHCYILFKCVSLKYKMIFNTIGFSSNKLKDGNCEYFYGDINLKSKSIKEHDSHFWELQKYLIK